MVLMAHLVFPEILFKVEYLIFDPFGLEDLGRPHLILVDRSVIIDVSCFVRKTPKIKMSLLFQ